MNVCVRGIASCEAFGSVTVVTEDWSFLVADTTVRFYGRHIVVLKGRAPPRYPISPFVPSKSRELIALGSLLS